MALNFSRARKRIAHLWDIKLQRVQKDNDLYSVLVTPQGEHMFPANSWYIFFKQQWQKNTRSNTRNARQQKQSAAKAVRAKIHGKQKNGCYFPVHIKDVEQHIGITKLFRCTQIHDAYHSFLPLTIDSCLSP